MNANIISIGYGRQVFQSGNAERERLSACAAQVGKFDMIIFSKKSHGLSSQVVSDHLTLHPTNSAHPLMYLVDAFFLARKIVKASAQPVTITTQDPFETALVGLLIAKLYRCRLIVQEHGDFFGLPHWRRESLTNRLRYIFGLFALRRADLVRVVSERSRRHLAKRGITKSVVFPVAVDPASFRNALADSEVGRLFPVGTFVFLSVARFVPQKNFPLLIKAFATAYKQNSNIGLLLVGAGSEEVKMRNLISTLPDGISSAIQIIPWSKNVAGLMRASFAYVLASNYEGWGRVLVEAILAELPIVATAVGCAEEVVRHEQQGLIVPVGDGTSLSEAMLRISTDKILYQHLKEQLAALNNTGIPGTDIARYKEQWAEVFLGK